MKKNKIYLKIIKILEKISRKKVSDNLKKINFNYIEEGFIDSLNFIKFIFEIEDRYKIQFSQKELSSRNLKKINSLSQIINKKINKHE